MAKAQLSCKHPVMKGIQWIEWVGLFIITIAVMVAIYQELLVMVDQR